MALALLLTGGLAAYLAYDHYRVKVGHTLVVGDSQAPFGPDATVTLQVSNYGRYPAPDVVVEARWPGMALQVMGGDSASLPETQASFGPRGDGAYGCEWKLLRPGEVRTAMFSVRKDPQQAAVLDPHPGALSVRVGGRWFRSERFLRLPLAGIDD